MYVCLQCAPSGVEQEGAGGTQTETANAGVCV